MGVLDPAYLTPTKGDGRYATRKLAAPIAAGNASAGTLPPAVAARTIREYPTFTKSTTLTLPFEAQSAPSILGMSFLDMRGWPGARKDVAMIYSTDHGTVSATTGCYIVDMDDPYGTNRVDKGLVLPGGSLQPEAPFPYLDWDLTVILGTGLTVTASTGRVTKANHGLPNTKKVIVSALTGTTGLTEGGTYYIAGASADGSGSNDFRLSLTEGGAPVTIAGDGTATISYVGAICMLTSTNTGVTWAEEAQATQTVVRYLSPTGLAGTWTLEGDCMVKPSPLRPGVPVTEYVNIFRRGNSFYAYTIDGGGAYALWMSTQGGKAGTWQICGDRIMNQSDWIMDIPGFSMQWLLKLGSGAFIDQRGAMWWVGSITGPTAGVEGFAYSDWFAAPLRPDYRGVNASPVKVTPASAPYDLDPAGKFGALGHSFQWGTQLVLPYRVGEKNTGVGLAILDQGSFA